MCIVYRYIDIEIDGKVHDTDNPQNMLLFNRKHFIGITFTCPYYQHKTLSTTHTATFVGKTDC